MKSEQYGISDTAKIAYVGRDMGERRTAVISGGLSGLLNLSCPCFIENPVVCGRGFMQAEFARIMPFLNFPVD